MAKENYIALAFDFDITLSPKYQQFALLEHLGLSSESEFFDKCASHQKNMGYGFELSYLKVLTDMAKVTPLSNKQLFDYGKTIELYEGLSEKDGALGILSSIVNILETEYAHKNITLECYCISGGLKPMIEGALEANGISKYFKDVFACEFDDNGGESIVFPTNIVSRSTKVHILYAISKGTVPSLGKDILEVDMPSDKRIPWSNIIYLGDGETDIPAFAVTKKNKGTSIAVYREYADESKTFASYSYGHKVAIENARADMLLPADYSESKTLKMSILHKIREIAEKI